MMRWALLLLTLLAPTAFAQSAGDPLSLPAITLTTDAEGEQTYYCADCGYTGRLTDTCPHCGSHHVRHLRRVSGYLAEAQSFAEGKKEEMKHRLAHLR